MNSLCFSIFPETWLPAMALQKKESFMVWSEMVRESGTKSEDNFDRIGKINIHSRVCGAFCFIVVRTDYTAINIL